MKMGTLLMNQFIVGQKFISVFLIIVDSLRFKFQTIKIATSISNCNKSFVIDVIPYPIN